MPKNTESSAGADQDLPSRISAVFEHMKSEAKAAGDKLTKERFAERWGVHSRSIYNWLDGSQEPDMDSMRKLASAFPNINMNWVLTGQGSMLRNAERPYSENYATSVSVASDAMEGYDDTLGRMALAFFRTFDSLMTQHAQLQMRLKSRG